MKFCGSFLNKEAELAMDEFEGYLKLDQKEDYKEGKRYIEKLARKFGLDYTLLRGY